MKRKQDWAVRRVNVMQNWTTLKKRKQTNKIQCIKGEEKKIKDTTRADKKLKKKKAP